MGPTSATSAVPDERAAPATIATTRVPELEVWSAPDAGAPRVTVLSARTRKYRHPRTLLVTKRAPGWLEVLLPIRPNGTTGWVREADVSLSATSYRIDVDITRRQLSLFDGPRVVAAGPAAIGKPDLPTPTGTFSVTDRIDMTARPDRLYGAFGLGLSGFSERLTQFRGGPGQLGIHGTGNPACLGRPASRGCIRVANETIIEIGRLVPLGTPVTISS